jgi:hypothetical protein
MAPIMFNLVYTFAPPARFMGSQARVVYGSVNFLMDIICGQHIFFYKAVRPSRTHAAPAVLSPFCGHRIRRRMDPSVMVVRNQGSSPRSMSHYGETLGGSTTPNRGSSPSGYAWRVTRWLTVSVAMSSLATLGAAGAWTLSDNALGTGAMTAPPRFANGQSPFVQSHAPAAGKTPSPLILTGVSGETLATKAPAVADFPASAAASGCQTQPSPCKKSHRDDSNAPVPDYALVFSREPEGAQSSSLRTTCLQTGWRAVVETLVLTGDPQPAVVRSL